MFQTSWSILYVGDTSGHVILHPNKAKLGDNVARSNTIRKRMSKTAP